jgi:hypothetical protein
VAHVGEFAIMLVKDTFAPAMVFQMRKAIDKYLRGYIRLDGQKHVNGEAGYESFG